MLPTHLTAHQLTKVFEKNSSMPGKGNATGSRQGLWSRLHNALSFTDKKEQFTALSQVSFSLQPGDVLGVIGRNGAGKSTLLQILSRIVAPSSGTVTYNGKIGAVLDVGTGFHPELTGRENVYFSGMLMGMSQQNITARFDQIVDFSGIGSFIDTPVKHYSSGMYVRLAFAVAAHLEADILLFDEVLAVGDLDFRLKVFNQIKQIAQKGLIVVMAGHDLGQIAQLCNQCIWLHKGMVMAHNTAHQVIEAYTESLMYEEFETKLPPDKTAQTYAMRTWQPNDAPGNEWLRLLKATIKPAPDYTGEQLFMDTPFLFELEYLKLQSGYEANFYVAVFHISGAPVLSSVNEISGTDAQPGRYSIACYFPPNLFSHGLYYIGVWISNIEYRFMVSFEKLLFFKVHCLPQIANSPLRDVHAYIRPQLHWEWKKLPD